MGLREVPDRLSIREISTVSDGTEAGRQWLRERDVGAKELKRALDKTHSLIQAGH